MCSMYYDPILVAAAAQAQAAQQAQLAQVDSSYRLQVGIALLFCSCDQFSFKYFQEFFEFFIYVSFRLFVWFC